METLRIALVATATFPLPPPTHTGDVVILDLARSLGEMGHHVDLYAPDKSVPPDGVRLLPMQGSWGNASPAQEVLEKKCFERHWADIQRADVIHDFSVRKQIAEEVLRAGSNWMNPPKAVSTLLGGIWTHPNPPLNIVVWSEAMRQRGLRGASDYEGTPFKEWDAPGPPIKDAHVVPGGVDTEAYRPLDGKDDYFLWMNRWHPAKGPQVAIDIARRTGIPLVMAGDHPDDERFEYQRNIALAAVEQAKDLPNVRFEWLPAKDPEHHEAKVRLYARAKAFLYTVQFQEPFGLSQVESLACGTPVIGLNYGSVPEVITQGKTGFVCIDSHTPDPALIAGPNWKYREMKIAMELVDQIDPAVCREEAVRRFDRRVMARAYLEEYRRILNGETWGE